MSQNFYDLSAKKPDGSTLEFSTLQDHVVLVVNTATKCGLAPQFKGLEELHQRYKGQGLQVLGFPCDQFAHQEPESDATMATTCQVNFGVTFPLVAKSDVNGPQTNPVFRFLKAKAGGFLSSDIKWNFTKFLIDRKGRVVKRFSPTTTPQAIEKHLQKVLKS